MSLVLHVCNVARAGKHVTPKLAALMIGACGRGDAHLRRIRDGAAPRPRLPAHFETRLRSCAMPGALTVRAGAIWKNVAHLCRFGTKQITPVWERHNRERARKFCLPTYSGLVAYSRPSSGEFPQARPHLRRSSLHKIFEVSIWTGMFCSTAKRTPLGLLASAKERCTRSSQANRFRHEKSVVVC